MVGQLIANLPGSKIGKKCRFMHFTYCSHTAGGFIEGTTMSLFDKWWDVTKALDREKMANLLEDCFVMVRHQTGG